MAKLIVLPLVAKLCLLLQWTIHALFAAKGEAFEDQLHNLQHGDQREANPKANVATQVGEQIDQLKRVKTKKIL